MSPRPGAVLVVVLASALSCSEVTTDVPPTPAGIVVVSGDAQTGTVGQALSEPITVRVVDGADNPLSGVSVTFEAGAGSLSPGSATTGSDGQATATWTLGTTAGSQSVTVSAGSISRTVSATAEAGSPTTLAVTPDTSTLTAIAETAQLTASAEDEYGNTVASGVSWSSSDEGVATVDGTGLVTAAGNGTARIAATVGSLADSVDVTVAQEVAGVFIDVGDGWVVWQRTLQLSGSAADANGYPVPGTSITGWTTADSAIATVDASGLVTGQGLGTVEITAMVDSLTGSATIGVTPIPEAALSKGQSSACLLDETGAAYCWGYNGDGQLGDGTSSDRTAPVPVAGGHRFVALGSAINRHRCGITEDGTAYCWGFGANGELGTGGTGSSSVPAQVAGGIAFRAVASGISHSCGLDLDGQAYCWGYNGGGQVGDGTTTNRPEPTAVATGLAFDELTVGGNTSCGRVGTDAYCWGDNTYGQTGDGTTTSPRTAPVQVSNGLAFARIVPGGQHTCAITTAGAPYCWGNNVYGELGDGTTTQSTAPVAVTGLNTADDLATGFYTTCAVDSGVGYCWGNNVAGVLGDGTLTSRGNPAPVAGGISWTRILISQWLSCGVSTSGGVYCWGPRENTGDGNGLLETRPVPVSGDQTFTHLDAGLGTACATTASGTYCWGSNGAGQLGNGDLELRATPTAVDGPVLARVSAGDGFACGLTDDGTAYCWGAGTVGQLGDGTGSSSTTPVAVDATFKFSDIATGDGFACGVREDNGAGYCWGTNLSDQLGTGDGVNQYRSPALIAGGHVWIDLAAGDGHACGVTTDGTAYCWGNNHNGKLGTGNTINQDTPTEVLHSIVFAGVTAGANHTCGWTANDEAYCWGSNGGGQLGNGDAPTARTGPVAVAGGLALRDLVAGRFLTCGLTPSGDPYCWGANSHGQLGDGSTANRDIPTPVDGGGTMLVISAGFRHSCGVATSGAGYCWGFVGEGQLGNGSTVNTTEPVPVAGGFMVPVP